MHQILEIDSISFTDDNYSEGYTYYIPCIEVSDDRSLEHGVTIYYQSQSDPGFKNKHIQRNVIEFLAFEKALEDILPNPGYHNPETFHLSTTFPQLVGITQHYHILTDEQPDKQFVHGVINRLYEQLGSKAFRGQFVLEILDFY